MGRPMIRPIAVNAEPLERRDGQVAVQVVAVRRVHVGAQPHAGVGGGHARRRRPCGERRDRGEQARAPNSCSGSSDGRPALGAVRQPRFDEWWSWLPASTTTSRSANTATEVLEEGPCGVDRVAARPVAQLEQVAEQDQPVDVGELGEQRLAQLGPAQQVDVVARTEVDV